MMLGPLLSEMSKEEIIKALRAKTVDRGATKPEAESAKAKADELEKKYGTKKPGLPKFDAKKWGDKIRDIKTTQAARKQHYRDHPEDHPFEREERDMRNRK